MDKLIMNKMEFYGYHGVYPEENKLGQIFYIDLEALADLSAAGKSDNLEDTMNYAEIYHLIKGIVEGKPFRLIEALAESIASQLLHTYTDISEIIVRVTKPHPPFPVHFQGVAVELRRKRSAL